MIKLPIFIQKLLLVCLILRGAELIAQNDIIKVRNEATINTAFQEYSPAFYQNGLIFIASNPAVATEKKEDSNTGKATTSLFFATRNAEGILQNPAPFAEELTTKFYDGPLSFNNDGSMIYFTRSNLKKGKPVKAKDGLVKLKIYSAEKKDNKWVNIQELPFNNAEFDCEHPSVSSDGRRLYFSSNRPGGFGGMDLYVSTLINNKWSDPVNLGPKINTDKNEIFPFSHPDGKVIFASNGHDGIGNLDIFFTMKTDTGWIYPRILPEPINSRSDDFGLILSADKKLGYFSSNRASGNGDDDIFNIDFSNLDAESIFPKIDTRTLSPEDLASTTPEPEPELEPAKVETPKIAENIPPKATHKPEPLVVDKKETPVAIAPTLPVVSIEKPAIETQKAEKKEGIVKTEEKIKESIPNATQEPTAAEAMAILKNKVKAEIAKSETNTIKNEPKASETNVVKNDAKVADAPVVKNEPKASETNVAKNAVKVADAPVVKNEPKVSETNIVKNDATIADAPVVKNEPKASETNVVKNAVKVADAPVVKNEPKVSETNIVKNDATIADAPVVKNEPKTSETNVVKNEMKSLENTPSKPVADVKVENKKKNKKVDTLRTTTNAPLSSEPVKPTESTVAANDKKKVLSPKEKKKAEKEVVIASTEPQFDETTVKVPKDTTPKIAKLDDGGFEEHTVVISSNEARVVPEPKKEEKVQPEAVKPVASTEIKPEIKPEIKIAEKPVTPVEIIAVVKNEEKPTIEPVKIAVVDTLKASTEVKQAAQTELVAVAESAKKEKKSEPSNTVIAQDKSMKKFLVVVGTYSIMENATIQKKIAEKKGFDETEIIQYNDTHLFGVCVKQFENEKDAQAMVRSISNKKGLEAFVKVLK
jgi:WD40-like Beta Propeller Repeat